MTPIDPELKSAIEGGGVALKKVDAAEIERRKEEKEKRQAELDKIKEALGE